MKNQFGIEKIDSDTFRLSADQFAPQIELPPYIQSDNKGFYYFKIPVFHEFIFDEGNLWLALRWKEDASLIDLVRISSTPEGRCETIALQLINGQAVRVSLKEFVLWKHGEKPSRCFKHLSQNELSKLPKRNTLTP